MYSPLWKITHQNPSVSCNPPFENHRFWWAFISANTVCSFMRFKERTLAVVENDKKNYFENCGVSIKGFSLCSHIKCEEICGKKVQNPKMFFFFMDILKLKKAGSVAVRVLWTIYHLPPYGVGFRWTTQNTCTTNLFSLSPPPPPPCLAYMTDLSHLANALFRDSSTNKYLVENKHRPPVNRL